MLSGTTTVHGRWTNWAARTAARPAFPPEEEKKCVGFDVDDAKAEVEVLLLDLRTRLPRPRILKEPEGWRFSSFRRILL